MTTAIIPNTNRPPLIRSATSNTPIIRATPPQPQGDELGYPPDQLGYATDTLGYGA